MALYFVFFSRRLIYVFLLVHLRDWLFFQWGALTFLSIGQLCYYLHYKPIVDKVINGLEVMNEVCLLFSLYFIALFSDMVTKPKF